MPEERGRNLSSIADYGLDTTISTTTTEMSRARHLELVESVRLVDGRLTTPMARSERWIDVGTRMSQLNLRGASRGAEPQFGVSESTYGRPFSPEANWDDIAHAGRPGIRLTYFPATEPDPDVALRHTLVGEVPIRVQTRDGVRRGVMSPVGEPEAYVIWRTRGTWVVLSSTTATAGELRDLAVHVRPANRSEREDVLRLATE